MSKIGSRPDFQQLQDKLVGTNPNWQQIAQVNQDALSGIQQIDDSYSRQSSSFMHDPNNRESDEWYLNYIQQYKNTDWYTRLLNNPNLRANNAPFSPNFAQGFLAFLGDHSAEDRYYADMLSKRNVYLSQIEDEIRQYKQNSPANQVSRMAAAGQNPDLLGTGGVAGAPENDNLADPFTPSQSSGNSAVEDLNTISNLAVGFISSCVGFAQSIQGLRAGSQALEAGDVAIAGNEISNYTSAMGFASSLLVNSIPASEVDTDKLNKDPNYVSDLFLQASKKVDTSMFSHRTRKQIGYFLNQLHRDTDTGSETYFYKNARAELLNRFTKLNADTAETRSRPTYSDDLDKMIQDMGSRFMRYYDDYLELYNKYRKKSMANSLAVENTPGIANSRALGEMSGNTADYYGAQTAKQTYNVNIPKWEIDRLNNNFLNGLNRGLHKYGTIGGFGALMLPGLASGLQSLPSSAGSLIGDLASPTKAGLAKKIAKKIL